MRWCIGIRAGVLGVRPIVFRLLSPAIIFKRDVLSVVSTVN